ncbi:MAG: hypothetical protein AUJ85_10080 [Elusimicrobia bacterium CG1_02_37_114]|nr:MAG: hypothetical protein AUJ85_10080 [Elusimicrobia bacterium CG1_02_37_114]PIV53396.1 MAG: hypothetical protein COS17_04230 [Elusimicrobia bacterium CG02_land_8_20_14_3_00_37_13]PIZ13496.1 MAG: hypothetical protein COY53_04645 [Elusimicrobia bacterium CG_4_10_14_0_8_um_filter_37_32]
MKFLIDENIGKSVIDYIRQKGYDVKVAKEKYTGREDYFLLNLAYKEKRIIITNDKDFGFLVYRNKTPSFGVILFRFNLEKASIKIASLEKAFKFYSEKMTNHFIVIDEQQIRIRPLSE